MVENKSVYIRVITYILSFAMLTNIESLAKHVFQRF